jgi:type I restriction enzyme S subunit
MPELRAQRAIAERVAAATGALKVTKAALERQISLLRERRQALITASVTGQLDVTTVAA